MHYQEITDDDVSLSSQVAHSFASIHERWLWHAESATQMILHLNIYKFWFILGFKVNTWICLRKRLMGLFVWEEMTLPKLVVIFSVGRSIVFATGNRLNSLLRSEMVIFRKLFYSLCFFSNWKYNSLFILLFCFKVHAPNNTLTLSLSLQTH